MPKNNRGARNLRPALEVIDVHAEQGPGAGGGAPALALAVA